MLTTMTIIRGENTSYSTSKYFSNTKVKRMQYQRNNLVIKLYCSKLQKKDLLVNFIYSFSSFLLNGRLKILDNDDFI